MDSNSFWTALFTSLGGTGGLSVCLFFLGKKWIGTRIEQSIKHEYDLKMTIEQARYDKEIAKFKEELRNELEIFKEKHLKEHQDKVAIYRMAVEIVSNLLSKIDMALKIGIDKADALKIVDDFNLNRMKLYGYLGMFVPQPVMDAHDSLVDHLFDILNGQKKYQWPEIREEILLFLNACRKDIDHASEPIVYKGRL